MILFPNVIAGILIGIINDLWVARIIIPFLWGIAWCLYQWVLGGEKITNRNIVRWNLSGSQAFYLIEYLTATTTALAFSLFSGIIAKAFS